MSLDGKELTDLEDRLWKAMVRDLDAPLDPLTIWQPMYINALAAVLTRGAPADWAALASLLREEHPIHPMLLPALAQALEARGRNKRDGRRRKLSPIEERQAARDVRHLRATGASDETARATVADRLGVSVSVVKRAFEKYIPPYQRPRFRTGGKF